MQSPGSRASTRPAASAPSSAIRKLASSPSARRSAILRLLTAQISIRGRSELGAGLLRAALCCLQVRILVERPLHHHPSTPHAPDLD
ncbi:unnamed protein product [Urochloa humidicola]